MALSNGPSDGIRINVTSDRSAPATSRDGGALKPKDSNQTVLPWIGWESFPPAHLAMKDKPFQ
ncbi:hypothetical protein JQ621_08115 [Bradyrhizobium manausense]|uniref:hypothetical protein n=1 Tax=Bradyrhizobium manausense TaxID=989370 RepID=UPI001BAD8DC1|nr:hypothetical protein [Bradyrhizobium manausense]MBR1087446.1 hypothetical protein [Bradyrhizobium manausense]